MSLWVHLLQHSHFIFTQHIHLEMNSDYPNFPDIDLADLGAYVHIHIGNVQKVETRNIDFLIHNLSIWCTWQKMFTNPCCIVCADFILKLERLRIGSSGAFLLHHFYCNSCQHYQEGVVEFTAAIFYPVSLSSSLISYIILMFNTRMHRVKLNCCSEKWKCDVLQLSRWTVVLLQFHSWALTTLVLGVAELI